MNEIEQLATDNNAARKEIEEMAKDIDVIYSTDFKGDYESGIRDIAKALIKMNYQKVDKNKVVLSREELNMLIDNIEKSSEIKAEELEKVRKETAAALLSELYYIVRFYYGNSANVLAWAREKATKLGVEIKE